MGNFFRTYQLLFFIFVGSLSAHSLWIPEGNLGWEAAKDCYIPLKKEIPPGAISPSLINLDRTRMEEYARESAELRLASLNCFRDQVSKNLPEEEPLTSDLGEYFKASLLSGKEKEEMYFSYEWRILLSDSRPYPLTPGEVNFAKQWFEAHTEVKEEITNLSIEYLSEKNPQTKYNRYLDLFTGYYGTLLRERDKFLLSLSLESLKSYTDALKQRKEKPE
ncbi:hypothetical protein ND861_13740 [Leptospira sp. 2 VSF19]|uniref:Uncharacterized protein n=1 Tax=Leptospira soteropolitanensis TaxID=2950025 RepID=A0AAW5VFJ6_9LEPT|nr:hypothetical protein [Leptospira soteropolitanensis]MCW7493707.1 hypothetical protein [Leptospira soteropolitanensis]MCW7501305.1 hypothetical protein [Leptospira soteropolitanensis]MCW7523509.1 hypothetical protein [Leptospira soteropolitanensis]MCW7527419.1 hypothetical protein [Leptospira soteropolitanensis]MCW7531275.1 hypothetical protein [Leptospira soteropolitanensis]